MRRAVEMPATIDAVDPAVVSPKAAAAGYLSDTRLTGFEIALSEGRANVVAHAVGGSETGAVTVAFDAGLEAVTGVIPDRGRPMPPGLFETAPALEAVDAMAENGRGLSLIGHFADGVSYRSAGGTNRLTLAFERAFRA